jgi:hypothetical protein
MFGLFSRAAVADPVLGELRFKKGRWRGLVQLEGMSIPLAISGSRQAPDESALSAARNLSSALTALRPQIEAALFGHYQPYAEAVASGHLPPPAEGIANVVAPGDVWRHAVTQFVSIEPMSGRLVTELGITVAWDEEHVLGARFDQNGFFELCGSTIPS